MSPRVIHESGVILIFFFPFSVELASISAGESDEEVDRVLMFQAAVQGYAPLILERSSRNTLQDFIDACVAVLNNVKQDETITNKLLDSNRLLEWIKVCDQF